jgi:peptidyl-prolyl cis-trans isomerase SurA
MQFYKHILRPIAPAGVSVTRNQHKSAIMSCDKGVKTGRKYGMQNILKIGLLSVLLFGAISVPAHAEKSVTIAAVVNEDAITWADVNDRLKLILASSGLPANKEFRERALPQVLSGLVEERLMMQEAARNEIEVSQEEIEMAFANIAAQNNFSPEQFAHLMRSQGIPQKTLFDQIEAQGAWTKVIQTVLRPQIDVTDTDVDVRQERLRQNIGKTEYLVSEIFLPVDNAKAEADIRKLATKLVGELRAGKAPFPAVAMQFSKAAGAEKGGSIGWVQKGQLPAELEEAIEKMNVEGISNPIRTPAGIHILQLRQTRMIEERTIPGREAILNQIGMERLDRLQRRTLMDLKAEAFIDKRV